VRRRDLLGLAAPLAGIACGQQVTPTRATASDRRPPLKAVLFDAFPVFDPRPVGALAERIFPGRGAPLVDAWRTRQFEYQWLRALGGQYADFAATTADALDFALRKLELEADDASRAELAGAYARLPAWPEVRAALEVMKSRGLTLGFLSNMTEHMLRSNIEHAGLAGVFDVALSTDERRTFKPAPSAYGIALDRLGLSVEEVLFVAFAGWDASGAKWFGYETFWLNRLGQPKEALSAEPDATGRTMNDVAAYLDQRSAPA
jgi:2-haloacid dehalogenase